MASASRRLRVLTWPVHGNYLWYLAHTPHEFFLPVDDGGRGGRGDTFPFGPNVHDIPAGQIRSEQFDCILFQHRDNWDVDQHARLSSTQRRLPRIYLEHDPPREHPTDTRHPVDDPDVLLVHVTQFNRLMWHTPRTPTRVIEHGVVVPAGVEATHELARGITAINSLARRGRRLGADVYQQLRAQVPIDLVGMESLALPGGIGEIPPMQLPAVVARYRFFCNPIRYTSLGLAVLEAMMIGVPIVGLATTEMVTTVEHGVSGFLATDPDALVPLMQRLLTDRDAARELGAAARRTARERFHIERFARDWDATLRMVTGTASRASAA